MIQTTIQPLIIFNSSPYRTDRIRSGIEYCLAAGAFDQEISLLLLGDAIMMLQADQQSDLILQKDLSKLISAFPMYGIKKIFIEASPLYKVELANQGIDIQKLKDADIKQLIHNSHVVLSF
jgi:tRNA 2-thiouridine synthesizing protein C